MKNGSLSCPTTIDLSWEKEIASFVAINGYTLCQNSVKNGYFEYVIKDKHNEKVITFTTKRNIKFGTRRSRMRKRR